MPDTNREAIGRVVMPVLYSQTTLIDMLSSAAGLDPAVRAQFERLRITLAQQLWDADTYFAPAKPEE